MTKYVKYFNYLLKHKLWVFYFCAKFAVRYKIPGLLFRGIIHDWDKCFNPKIFIPYANATFGPGRTVNYGLKDGMPDLKVLMYEAKFRIAILKHKEHSKHHWDYWASKDFCGKLLREIPDIYLYEMLADWFSANKCHRDFHSSFEWYWENHKKIQLHELTRIKVEELLRENIIKEGL